MRTRTAPALLLAAAMLVSTGTAFSLGSKGGGMEGKKDAGMMKEEGAMETQGSSRGKEKTMMDDAKTMQHGNMPQKDDATVKDEGGMDKKDTMGTKGM
jgi:hypothetical protein